MRYRFYREHKLISAMLNDLERLMAQADFCDVDELARITATFQSVANMLTMHARYEDERVHRLLRAKNSSVHLEAEHDHAQQQAQIGGILHMLQAIADERVVEKKIDKGYDIYLAYRKFVADNLLHLHDEETLILPELQRLYSDEELQSVAAIAYREMTPDDMVNMVHGLFTHFNTHDRYSFLSAMKRLEPEKFMQAWQSIKNLLNDDERSKF